MKKYDRVTLVWIRFVLVALLGAGCSDDDTSSVDAGILGDSGGEASSTTSPSKQDGSADATPGSDALGLEPQADASIQDGRTFEAGDDAALGSDALGLEPQADASIQEGRTFESLDDATVGSDTLGSEPGADASGLDASSADAARVPAIVYVVYGGTSVPVDLSTFSTTTIKGLAVVSLSDIWSRAGLGADLSSLTANFVGDDGYQSSQRSACSSPFSGGNLLQVYIAVQTRNVVAGPGLSVPMPCLVRRVVAIDGTAIADAASDAHADVATDSKADAAWDSADGPDVQGDSDTLGIPAAGEQFSPPLSNADSLPSGVWYCDMGTVHWAQAEHGAGTCPICGMNLVQKP